MDAELSLHADEVLSSVVTEFSQTATSTQYLERFTKFVRKSRTLSELHTRIVQSLQRLDALETFKSCDIEVLPGAKLSSAVIVYRFTDLRWWNLSMGVNADNEGGRTVASGLFRNLRGRADSTQVNLEYKYNTGTWGYQFSHTDRLFIPGKCQAVHSLKKYTEEIDTNLVEHGYGGSFSVLDLHNRHKLEIGSYIRTNNIDVEKCSARLLQSSLPVSVKNFINYCYTRDTRDSMAAPTTGSVLKLSNEIAIGDSCFQKVEAKLHCFMPFTAAAALQLSAWGGLIVPWALSSVKVNDALRVRFLKGFRAVGAKEPPLSGSVGDDLGCSGYGVGEAKLHFYGVSLLKATGLTPFIYGNAVLAQREGVRAVRGSVGFGVGWSGAFGRIELSYASRVWARPGDHSADFQVLFGE